MTIYFTADLHLGHKNIIEYSNRPFHSTQEMDDCLINNWNNTINDSDEIYILGDLTFYMPKKAVDLVHHLKGRKHLIAGNHDKHLTKNKEFISLFESFSDFGKTIKIHDTNSVDGIQRIVLCHYPLLTWEKAHYGAWHLHGHSHGSLKDDNTALRLDIGIDAWTEPKLLKSAGTDDLSEEFQVHTYKPVSYEDIKRKMLTKTFKPVDHHAYRE